MSERKIINKYFPPDFDPEKLITRKRFYRQNDWSSSRQSSKPSPRQMNVRMMYPFTLCCSTCHEFTYIGTKFNSRVEKVEGEDYLGVAIWRFYGRCPNCRAEIGFKTDPQNADYILEFGAMRTYDAAKDEARAESALREKEEADLEGNTMKQLEAKTYNTSNELMAIEQLEELKKINKRMADRDSTVNTALDWLSRGSSGDVKRSKAAGNYTSSGKNSNNGNNSSSSWEGGRGEGRGDSSVVVGEEGKWIREKKKMSDEDDLDDFTEEEKRELEAMRKDMFERQMIEEEEDSEEGVSSSGDDDIDKEEGLRSRRRQRKTEEGEEWKSWIERESEIVRKRKEKKKGGGGEGGGEEEELMMDDEEERKGGCTSIISEELDDESDGRREDEEEEEDAKEEEEVRDDRIMASKKKGKVLETKKKEVSDCLLSHENTINTFGVSKLLLGAGKMGELSVIVKKKNNNNSDEILEKKEEDERRGGCFGDLLEGYGSSGEESDDLNTKK